VRGSRGAFAVGVLAASGHDAREMRSLRARNPKWAGWFVLALMAAPAPSFAAEPSKTALAAARELFSRAERDEDNGQWADALDKLLRAGSVKMTSGIRFHIALCEEKLGKLANALGDYVMAEAAARSEGNNEVLEATLDPLASLRARVPTLTITLPADARDAETTLDGARLPTELLGTAIPINVGSRDGGRHRSPAVLGFHPGERKASARPRGAFSVKHTRATSSSSEHGTSGSGKAFRLTEGHRNRDDRGSDCTCRIWIARLLRRGRQAVPSRHSVPHAHLM
jgi:hypothetical protein